MVCSCGYLTRSLQPSLLPLPCKSLESRAKCSYGVIRNKDSRTRIEFMTKLSWDDFEKGKGRLGLWSAHSEFMHGRRWKLRVLADLGKPDATKSEAVNFFAVQQGMAPDGAVKKTNDFADGQLSQKIKSSCSLEGQLGGAWTKLFGKLSPDGDNPKSSFLRSQPVEDLEEEERNNPIESSPMLYLQAVQTKARQLLLLLVSKQLFRQVSMLSDGLEVVPADVWEAKCRVLLGSVSVHSQKEFIQCRTSPFSGLESESSVSDTRSLQVAEIGEGKSLGEAVGSLEGVGSLDHLESSQRVLSADQHPEDEKESRDSLDERNKGDKLELLGHGRRAWPQWSGLAHMISRPSLDKEQGQLQPMPVQLPGLAEVVNEWQGEREKWELHNHLLFWLRYGRCRNGSPLSANLMAKFAPAVLEDLVIAVADEAARNYLEQWMMDMDYRDAHCWIHSSLASSRGLEKFRNEVALRRWLNHNFVAVEAMYEDRYSLWTMAALAERPASVEEPDSVSTGRNASSSRSADISQAWTGKKHLVVKARTPLGAGQRQRRNSVRAGLPRWGRAVRDAVKNVFARKSSRHAARRGGAKAIRIVLEQRDLLARRNKELSRLRGWRLVYCIFLEVADVAGPILQTLLGKLGDTVSFLLTALIGRSLGLIYRGIRQSLRLS